MNERSKKLTQSPIIYSREDMRGGSQFVSLLIKEKLIDELHLFINPAAIGKGMPVFHQITGKQDFKLVSSRQFDCGIVVLTYQPV